MWLLHTHQKQIFNWIYAITHETLKVKYWPLIFFPAMSLSQRGDGPVNPVGVDEAELVGAIRFDERSVSVLTFQKFVDERVQIWLLRRREGTVRMVANLRDAHMVGNAERLPNLVGGLHAPEDGLWAEPIDARVVDDQKSAGRNECSEHMVVEWKGRDRLDVVSEVGGEPDVFADNFRGSLSARSGGKHCVRDTPASCAART